MASRPEFRAVCGAGFQVSCALVRCNRLPERQVVLRFSIRGAVKVQQQPAHLPHCDLFQRPQCTCRISGKIWCPLAQRRRQPCPSALQLLLPARKQRLPPFASGPKSESGGSIIPPAFLPTFLPLSRLISMSFSFVACSFCVNAWIGGS